MEKEERAGNGSRLQGLLRAPIMSDLDVRREALHLLVSSPTLPQQQGNPSPVQRGPLNGSFPPKKPWVLLFLSKCVPDSCEPQTTFSGPPTTVDIQVWPS